VAKTQAKKATNAKMPDKITGSSMVSYLAEKSGLARKEVKQVVEDLMELIETGVMRGERVAFGKMGKAFIRIRPARKARQGINPLTKEPITIAAKPATKVPRFTFSKVFKEASLKAKVKK
jgi:nucleoid DNA-binding protein